MKLKYFALPTSVTWIWKHKWRHIKLCYTYILEARWTEELYAGRDTSEGEEWEATIGAMEFDGGTSRHFGHPNIEILVLPCLEKYCIVTTLQSTISWLLV